MWPAPPSASNPVYAYAIKDYPRFFVPAWSATPIPAGAKVNRVRVSRFRFKVRVRVRFKVRVRVRVTRG